MRSPAQKGSTSSRTLAFLQVRAVLEFAAREGLVVLADEVYQENVYDGALPFHSFKKVAASMGKEAAALQLVSFHSTSKGFLGGPGLRG